MENIIAVFNNRNHTMQFASYLRRLGIKCQVVNTPRELSVSCGISVIFNSNVIYQAKTIINNHRFSSFVKLYTIISNGVLKKYRPI